MNGANESVPVLIGVNAIELTKDFDIPSVDLEKFYSTIWNQIINKSIPRNIRIRVCQN